MATPEVLNKSRAENIRERSRKMLDDARSGKRVDPRGLMSVRCKNDLKPCTNCGRIVYAGKCCNNPN